MEPTPDNTWIAVLITTAFVLILIHYCRKPRKTKGPMAIRRERE